MCRIIGIAGPDANAARLILMGIHSQQYGGTTSCGVASLDSSDLYIHTDLGLVGSVFDREQCIEKLSGNLAIGHNACRQGGLHPLVLQTYWGKIALCADATRELADQFAKELQTSTGEFEKVVVELARRFFGPYAFLILGLSKVYALRGDGRKPLCFGQMQDGEGYIVASQSNALSTINARFIRNLEPGEMVVFDQESYQSIPFISVKRCIDEVIFTQRPDSSWGRSSLYRIRHRMGRQLGKEFRKSGIKADLVYPIPSGGNIFAEGIAEVLKDTGVIYNPQGLIKNYYPRIPGTPFSVIIQITFPQEIEEKSVIIVNDALQSGAETSYVVSICQKAKAREIHVATASLTLSSCNYGVETPPNLIGPGKTFEEIAEALRADSFITLKPWRLLRAIGVPTEVFCIDCLKESISTPTTG